MNKKLLLLSFILISFIAFFVWWRFGQPAEPKVLVEPQSYDFGEVKKATYSASFVVKNIGGGILKIEGPLVSCGCTKTELSKTEISKNEKADLKVEVDFSEHSGGLAESAVYLKTNDPKNKEITIEMKGNVTK